MTPALIYCLYAFNPSHHWMVKFYILHKYQTHTIQLLKWSRFQIHSTTKAKIDTRYHRKHRECNILLCARFSPKHLVEATASEITCITRREKSMPFDFRLKHWDSKVNILVLWHCFKLAQLIPRPKEVEGWFLCLERDFCKGWLDRKETVSSPLKQIPCVIFVIM